MTKVVLTRSSEGGFVSCLASGHSGYASKGSDIVCSAVSIVLAGAYATLQKAKVALEVLAYSAGSYGYAIRGEAATVNKERLCCIADFIECSMEWLCKSYGEYVDFTVAIRRD